MNPDLIAAALGTLALPIGAYIYAAAPWFTRPTPATDEHQPRHRPATVNPVPEHWIPPVGARAVALHVDTQYDMPAIDMEEVTA